jgi:hypothetical protein
MKRRIQTRLKPWTFNLRLRAGAIGVSRLLKNGTPRRRRAVSAPEAVVQDGAVETGCEETDTHVPAKPKKQPRAVA